MKVIKWKKEKKNIYSVILEKNQSYSFYDAIVLKYSLLLKKQFKEKELEKLQAENQSLDAYYKALQFLNRKMRSSLEIEKFLKKAEFPKKDIDQTIQKLTNEGYLNDEQYEEVFLHDKIALTTDGPYKIQKELKQLGIEGKKVFEIEPSIWEEKINKIIQKRLRERKKESSMMFKNKLKQYLFLHGYNEEMIAEPLANLSEENDPNILLKEKEKLKQKLSKKYAGSALDYQIKMRLYQKKKKKEEIDQAFES